jgi:hypothetical protein
VPDLNALILNGDFLAHHMTTGKTADEALTIIKDIIRAVGSFLQSQPISNGFTYFRRIIFSQKIPSLLLLQLTITEYF